MRYSNCFNWSQNSDSFESVSTSNTLTISVERPTLNLSLGLIFLISPSTLKNVTIPVAPAVPIPCDKISLVEEIPILYDQLNLILLLKTSNIYSNSIL